MLLSILFWLAVILVAFGVIRFIFKLVKFGIKVAILCGIVVVAFFLYHSLF